MKHFVNKRLLLAVNRLVLHLSGGSPTGAGQVRSGQNMSFADLIVENNVFGQEIYPDIFHRAAAYMFHIIKNHSFHDGNKRTGLAAAVASLQMNGYDVKIFDVDESYDFVMGIAGGENNPDTKIPEIAEWLKKRSVKI